MRTRYPAYAAPFVLAAALAATILLTSCSAPQPNSATPQTSEDSPRDAPATPAKPQPPDRCATPTDPTCIRAVYQRPPNDYPQVQDIPDSVLIQSDADGRYQVERGQRIAVVTAAQLPSGYTSFFLQRRPLQATVRPTSHERLIAPSGTTYTFTVTTDEAASNLISFDLTAARARPQPGHKPELADVVVTTNFLVPTLRYDTLDITGAATTAGSYAFLDTAGDAASATDNVYRDSFDLVELRLHTIDASGASRAAFYDTLRVGDTFDFQTNGLDCGYRLKVTSVGAAGSTRGFGIAHVRDYGEGCGDAVDDPGAPKNVTFVWGVSPGIPGPDGLRTLLRGEPAGEGTYHLGYGSRFVFDVPAGMQVIHDGHRILEPAEDDPPDAPRSLVLIVDVATGSKLGIDPATGRETHRIVTSAAVGALFDQIMASLRTPN